MYLNLCHNHHFMDMTCCFDCRQFIVMNLFVLFPTTKLIKKRIIFQDKEIMKQMHYWKEWCNYIFFVIGGDLTFKNVNQCKQRHLFWNFAYRCTRPSKKWFTIYDLETKYWRCGIDCCWRTTASWRKMNMDNKPISNAEWR